MTFGADHYVPIVKIKRGEKRALNYLAGSICGRVTPLLEVVVRNPAKHPTVKSHLDNTFEKLRPAVNLFSRYFLDSREIAPDGPAAATEVFQRAVALAVPFTPVTGISRAVDEKAALAHRAHGIAIRVTRDEFETGRLPGDLRAFLKTNSLAPADVDLIVDLGAVDDMVTVGIENMTQMFLADVPDPRDWRTLTVSACAFPFSMGVVERDSFELIDRSEWQAWRDGLHANRKTFARLPTFSDCGIQYPTGVEDFDFRTMSVSASVRYTLQDQWLLIKGVSTKKVEPSVQFPQLATKLVYGHLSQYFAGASHCRGCGGMHDAANGAPKLGSPEAWRRLGSIHHITTTVDQIAALPFP